MTYLKTRIEPRHHRLPLNSQSGESKDYGVRAYRASPEDAILQLLTRRSYMTVSLSEAECRAAAQLLLAAADDLATAKVRVA